MIYINNSTKLIRYFGSVKISHLFVYLEFKFKMKKSGFWKFYEPCKRHLDYQIGDSLFEEMGYTRRVFKRAFQKIGVCYATKEEFKKQKDPFQGKLYACYYNRKSNKTYFFRNHAAVEFLKKDIESGESLFRYVDNYVDNYVDKQCKESVKLLTGNDHFVPLLINNINIITNKKTLGDKTKRQQPQKSCSKNWLIVKEMVGTWIRHVEKPIKFLSPVGISLKRGIRLRKILKHAFYGDISRWESYCSVISSNNFLMGGGNLGWKASIDWAIQPQNVEKVLSGKYKPYFT